jgi:hypothetical protein
VPIVAPGKEVVVMVNAGGGFTVMASALLAETPVASTTWKVNDTGPLLAPVGSPVIAPVPLLKLNPTGSVPEVTVQM